MRTETATELIDRFASTGVLLDANLLLLLVVGSHDRRRISTFKRLSVFAPEDFELLEEIVGRFKRLIVTPNVLTEVSNLAGNLPSNIREAYFQTFSAAIAIADEAIVPSASAASRSEFRRFGLTDTVIMEVAATPTLILTIDFPLAQYLASRSLPVINFNHIRYLNWS